MAIQIYCSNCYTSNGLDAKKCSSCGKAFGRDKKYRVQIQVKGKRTSRVVDNLTIAREVEAALKGDLVRDEYDIADHKPQEKPLTLADVWEKYLPWAKEHKKSWRDDEWYYGKHIEPRFGSKALTDISTFDIEKMKTELKKGTNSRGKPFAAQTIKHQIVIIRRLFNLARKWDLYDGKNPVDSVSMPKVDNQKTEMLTDDEAQRLLKTLESWPCRESAVFIKFAMFTGMRRGELIRLAWNDIDFERGSVTLRNPKGGKTITVSVSTQALDTVRDLPVTSELVFPGKGGMTRYDFKGPWRRIRKAAGLPADFRFHGLRHHFASTLVSNGVDMAVVSKMLTHKDLSTTQRYAHLSPGALKEAARISGELLTPKQAQVLKIVK
ncbi:MAG: tyrosine-type recombinase/integrase [Syntrophobacteraceae bacterium]